MALRTLGTNATTTLQALSWNAQIADADYATFRNAILNDQINGNPIYPGAFVKGGLLYVPNRGVLKLLSGDYIAYDSTGWPILVSANAIANGPWTHT